MKISFFGKVGSFDFYHIGGTDSIIRRLSFRLSELGEEVGFVHYGNATDDEFSPHPGIKIFKFKLFHDALTHLEKCYEHIVSIYLTPSDRLQYANFRKSNKNLHFHHLYQSWPESPLKRKLYFAEAQIFPFNGFLFCISPRIYKYVSQFSKRSVLLYPPVPENFHLNPSVKYNREKLKVSYIGRIDPNKGTNLAVEIFRQLSKDTSIETSICGFLWSHRKETIHLHREILPDPRINYHTVEYNSWSSEIDVKLSVLLKETDILLLPYRKLSSTVDMPLLLLEGMAHLCAVITPDFGDLHKIYGESPINVNGNFSKEKIIDVITSTKLCLQRERERLYKRCKELSFDAITTTNIFRKSLETTN